MTRANVIRFPSGHLHTSPPGRDRHDGRADEAPRFLVLHLILTTAAAMGGGIIGMACAWIAGGGFWHGLTLYGVGGIAGCLIALAFLSRWGGGRTKNPARAPRGRSSQPPFGPPDEDRLFAALDRTRGCAPEKIGLVVVFARYTPSATVLRDEIEKLGAVVMIVEDVTLPGSWIASRGRQIACLVFDAHHLASRGAEDLPARMRRAAAGPAIVILGGRDTPYYPPGGGRDAQAEIVLPTPVGGTELRLGILSAIEMRHARQEPVRPPASFPFGNRQEADRP